MKTLYDIYESILDDEEDILDKADQMADDAVEQQLKNALLSNKNLKLKYNPKKKSVKVDSATHIHLIARKGEVYVETFGSGNMRIHTSWNDIKKMVDYFDTNFQIDQDVIQFGLKFSDLGMIGKNHLIIFGSNANSPVMPVMNVDAFFDQKPDPSYVLSTDYSPEIASSNFVKDFACLRMLSPYSFNAPATVGIKGCKAKILFLACCRSWLLSSTDMYKLKIKSFDDLFTRDEYVKEPVKDNAQKLIKQFLLDNQDCKIIFTFSWNHPTHFWLEGDEVKFKEIKGTKPWTKI